MRISTSQGYDNAVARMNALTARTDRLQTQIATNKRIDAPSEDPAAFARLSALKTAAASDTVHAGNVAAAQTLLDQSDTALASVQTQLQRAQELALKANSGALTASDRKIIGDELQGIVDDIYALANTRTAGGEPLFGGTGSTAFERGADGAVRYIGGADGVSIPIGDGVEVIATSSGADVFNITTSAGETSVFAVVQKFADALRTDGAAVPAVAAEAIAGLDTATGHIATARASVGARGARLDLEAARLKDVAADREVERSGLEDTDITAAIADLQKTMTVLQATQASFTKLSQLSLFDYLR